MTWFKVSDRFAYDSRALHAGARACGLWVLAGSWLASQSPEGVTDGTVPQHVVRTLGGKLSDARRLVQAALWEPVDGGFRFVANDLWQVARREREPIPPALRLAVLDRDGYACVICRTTLDLQMDHVYPWSLGGPDTFDNLQTLCRPCNAAKGARV